MAGAYRCPNCGIDFPTGTPGAPRAAHSPADADPGGRRRDPPQPTAANIAERLEIALVGPTGPAPSPPQERPEPRLEPRSEPPRTREEVVDVVPEPADDDDGRDFPRAAEFRTVPGAPSREGRAEPTLGSPADPGRRGTEADFRRAPEGDRGPRATEVDPGRRGSNLTVSPKRGSTAPLVAEPEPRAMVPASRRRRSGGLGGTVATALVLLGLVGAGAWWVSERGVAESLTSALVPAVASPEPLAVSADEGWVTVPSGMGAVRVSGDGPFRVRVGNEIYTVRASNTLRVAGAENQSVAVRAIRAPTTVRVTPEG